MVRRLGDDVVLAFLAIVSIATACFLLLPIVVAVSMSFDARGYLGPFPPPAYSLRWYTRFLSTDYYLTGLRTSLLVAVLATCVSTALGVTTALAMDRYDFKGKQAIASVFLSPLVIPAVVIGFALLLYFSALGIQSAFVRLLCAHALITVPYTIRTTLVGLTGIRKSVLEAALSLGANDRQAFWDITFPLAKTGIVAGAIFALAVSLDDVAVSMFLSNPDTYTLPVALISMMRANFDLSIAAAAVLFLAVTIVLVLVLDRIVGLDRIIGRGIYRG